MAKTVKRFDAQLLTAVTSEMLEAVQEVADRRIMSRADVVRVALDEHLAKWVHDYRPTSGVV